jgi:hypothetical protein
VHPASRSVTEGETVTIPHARPVERQLSVDREPRDGRCPECGEEQLFAYPVISAGGWFDVVKCAVQLLSDML